jgi:hypothetical protein
LPGHYPIHKVYITFGSLQKIHVLGTLHKVPSFKSLGKSFPELGGYSILLIIAGCGVTKKRKVMLKTWIGRLQKYFSNWESTNIEPQPPKNTTNGNPVYQVNSQDKRIDTQTSHIKRYLTSPHMHNIVVSFEIIKYIELEPLTSLMD